MKVKPILFSTDMVQAILDGRKTMTRRVIKLPPDVLFVGEDADGYFAEIGKKICDKVKQISPKYHPGDVLWVRETWTKHGYADFCLDGFDDLHNDNPQYDDGGIMGLGAYIFKADGVKSYEEQGDEPIKWRPSIRMPREACRLFLRVTDVGAERLNEITEADAISEGCRAGDKCAGPASTPAMTAKQAFMWLWQKRSSKGGYDWCLNPWVFVYTFERCERPEGWPGTEV